MKTTEFVDRILQRLGFEPTQDQLAATRMFAAFLADRAPESAMVMRGSAGTGKTTLASAMVGTLHSLGQPIVLMAPTGRAAKVFAVNSHLPAATIHRTIYRERSVAPDSQFNLNFNRSRRTLFVVDEASMISGRSSADRTFGTGNLLDDLIKFVYSGDQCRLLLIGDSAQLPPVGEQEAPALSPDELGAYGLKVYACDLGEVVRQGKTSGILLNATQLRLSMPSWEEQMTNPILPKLRVKGLADVVRVPGNELIEQLASSYSEVGVDETIVVTRSNKRATIYNQGIRARVLDLDDVLCGADRVMVVKNKYLSNTDGALRTTRQLSFIAEGFRLCENVDWAYERLLRDLSPEELKEFGAIRLGAYAFWRGRSDWLDGLRNVPALMKGRARDFIAALAEGKVAEALEALVSEWQITKIRQSYFSYRDFPALVFALVAALTGERTLTVTKKVINILLCLDGRIQGGMTVGIERIFDTALLETLSCRSQGIKSYCSDPVIAFRSHYQPYESLLVAALVAKKGAAVLDGEPRNGVGPIQDQAERALK